MKASEDISTIIQRRLCYPPGYSGIIWPNADDEMRARELAWERYDLKIKLAGLAAII